ncbi:MAG: PilZ domain-containing protein [Desulfobacteraceae bacterium]|nr:PilZ domain-containing protein [Desulfobacteraceae bacterium]MCB9494147.1 PilZ domain-containing protein [Desulfobacteraceae bacterium]
MTDKKPERRKSARVYLKPDIATALLKSEKFSTEIFAKILNVSQGGFGLGIQRQDGIKIVPGDSFVIEDILGRKELRNDKKITISVRWVLDYHGMGSLGAGCCFKEVDSLYMEKITKFIEDNI